jgi:3-oxoacyl-[acyl-carrier-protein] synthase III
MIGTANGVAISITGLGCHVPERVVTNDELSTMMDTSDEWIRERTGIRERRIAEPEEALSDLCLPAARQALEDAGLDGSQIDLIIVATVTPDMAFPSTGAILADLLGAEDAAAYDLSAGCTGFMYAVAQGYGMVAGGLAQKALVVGGDVLSKIMDWTDRSTSVLFGDGAGAVVLEAQTQLGGRDDRGILATLIRSDGRFEDLLYVDGGPGSTKTTGHLRMNGREVFRHAVQKISGVIEETLVMTGYAADEVDLYVPHQANKRILDGIAKRLSIPPEKIVYTLAKHGNTSAASIPLALNQAFEDHRLVEGRLVLMEAMGGGLTWGAALARW